MKKKTNSSLVDSGLRFVDFFKRYKGIGHQGKQAFSLPVSPQLHVILQDIQYLRRLISVQYGVGPHSWIVFSCLRTPKIIICEYCRFPI